ncbi:hypothetical protein ACIQVE_01650 [Pseudomonas sp. NPDC098747]|uniref:hypothetical protein n=1 Tax=Pseudomonas sp. NPDC098747 TaxID=3364487 RepID=UPI00383B4CE1
MTVAFSKLGIGISLLGILLGGQPLSAVHAEPGKYSIPTLTFHVIALNAGTAVLGGTLEGPSDTAVIKAEIVVQFYNAAKLLETRTLQIPRLTWPRTHFRLPIPSGVDCYEIIALRTFSAPAKAIQNADATAEHLPPGRCQISS